MATSNIVWHMVMFKHITHVLKKKKRGYTGQHRRKNHQNFSKTSSNKSITSGTKQGLQGSMNSIAAMGTWSMLSVVSKGSHEKRQPNHYYYQYV